ISARFGCRFAKKWSRSLENSFRCPRPCGFSGWCRLVTRAVGPERSPGGQLLPSLISKSTITRSYDGIPTSMPGRRVNSSPKPSVCHSEAKPRNLDRTGELARFHNFRGEILILRLGNFVFLVMQFLAGLNDDAVVYLAFEVFQAVVSLVVEKIRDIGMEPHHDVLTILNLRLLALDRA